MPDEATEFPFGANVPSAADLDAVAEEQKVAEATAAKPKRKKTVSKSAKKVSTTKVTTKKKTTAKKTAAKKATPKKAATKKSDSNGQRGRTSQFAGKKLFKVATENPRREGTHGHNSFKIIKDGMTYEQFIAKGGRLVDLVWDVAKKNVKVK